MNYDRITNQIFIANLFKFEIDKNTHREFNPNVIWCQNELARRLYQIIGNGRDENYWKNRVHRMFSSREWTKITDEELITMCDLFFFENKEYFVAFYHGEINVFDFIKTFPKEKQNILLKNYSYFQDKRVFDILNAIGIQFN